MSRLRRHLITVLVGLLLALPIVYLFMVRPMMQLDAELQAAKTSLDIHDLADAQAHLEAVLKLRPDHGEAHYLLAQTLRRQEQYSQAQEHLDRARRYEWIAELIELEERLARAQRYGPRGENEQILGTWIVIRHPEERVIFDALVRGYRTIYNLNAAMQTLNRWIERYPDDWRAYAMRAEIRELADYGDATRADYDKALSLRPTAYPVHRDYGLLLLHRHIDVNRAAKHLEAALVGMPEDVTVMTALAECDRQNGNLQLAQQRLATVLQHQSGFGPALRLIGEMELHAGNTAMAIDYLERAQRATPADRDALYQLEQAYRKGGTPEQVATTTHQREQMEADMRELVVLLGQTLEKPSDADLRQRIGACMLRLHREDEAVAWFNSALGEQPNHVASHRALADYYRDHQQPNQAEMHRQQAESPMEKR